MILSVEKSRITSLLVVKDSIYIGTLGGIILILNYQTQEVSHILQGYNSQVSSLIPIAKHNYTRRLSRLYSRRENLSSSKSFSSGSIAEWTLTNSGDRTNSERTIVLSFGKEYRGVLGTAKNHPSSFLLPSDNSLSCSFCLSPSRVKCMCEGDSLANLRTAKPDPKTGYLLYWLDDEELTVNNYVSERHRSSVVSSNSTIPETSRSISSTTS